MFEMKFTIENNTCRYYLEKCSIVSIVFQKESVCSD